MTRRPAQAENTGEGCRDGPSPDRVQDSSLMTMAGAFAELRLAVNSSVKTWGSPCRFSYALWKR